MKVFLTGGSGFVGKGIRARLQQAGITTVCLVRPGSEAKVAGDAVDTEGLELSTGDLFDLPSLVRGMQGCDAVIHLVGIIRERPSKGVTFPRIHVEGTRNILEAARQAQVKRFVHMSALGARENATSDYHKTKYEAEQLVQNSGIPYVIFRPSVIFGPGDEFVNMLADLVRLPLTPVIGDGSYLLQPVARETVADVFVQALTSDAALNQVFETGGPEPISYGRILDEIGAVLGKPRVRKMHIPLPLMKPVVNLMEGFSFFPITNTQLTMLVEGNFCRDDQKLYETFSTDKIPFGPGIATYLKR
ncbi:complex I NDUFA9 subunit family protein [Brevibacillus sp. TJ4]|uniref:complex I NDUFA9 subunit family protein n=1 Tax=Brevibacillus sp. TJ4 TaxID=3234853 RepID=UPI0037D2DB2D